MRKENITGKLLGNRTSSLCDLSFVFYQRPRRTGNRLKIQAAMLIKLFILNADHQLYRLCRNILQTDVIDILFSF